MGSHPVDVSVEKSSVGGVDSAAKRRSAASGSARRFTSDLLGVVILLACAAAGCSDVGDSSALPDNQAVGSQADAGDMTAVDATVDASEPADSGADATPDGAAPGDTSAAGTRAQGGDAQQAATQDGSVADIGSPIEQGDSTISDSGHPDAEESGASDSMVADVSEETEPQDARPQDAGPRDTGPQDAAVADTGVRDSASQDATADSTAPGGGGGDASQGAGPLVPCTTAGQTGCVSCPGISNGVCAGTAALFVQKDIDTGIVTSPGPDNGMDGCYECLLGGSCVDAPLRHVNDVGCEDLAGSFTNGSGASIPAAATCLATLACVIDTGSPCGLSSNGLSFCYCGMGGGAPTVCASHGAAANGACFATEVAGFSFASTDANDILLNFTDTTEPSGQANNIVGCALSNGCNQCLQ
jgi:hypothetical protein